MPRFRLKAILILMIVLVCLFKFILVHFKSNVEGHQSLNKIEALMVKNMLKDEEKQLKDLTADELKKLPKPQQVIQSAKGHVGFKKLNSTSVIEQVAMQLKSIQCSPAFQDDIILVLGHSKSGMDQFLTWLHVNLGLFILFENASDLTAKEILYSLTNLSNCAIIHHGDNFNLDASPFKFNSFILDICSNDKCLTSPSLWSQVCTLFSGRILASTSTKEMAELSKNKLIWYLFKDPRSSLDPNSTHLAADAADLCESLQHDLYQMDHLSDQDHSPKMLRYEDLTMKLEESLSIEHCSSYQEALHPEDWKLKFSMEQVLIMEDKCRHVLSRLEYPLFGSDDLLVPN